MALAQSLLSGTDAVIVEVPAGKSYAITTIMVTNIAGYNSAGTNDSSFDLHFIKDTEAKADKNKVVMELPVPGGETFTLDSEKIILEAGDKVVAVSNSPHNLALTLSYLDV